MKKGQTIYVNYESERWYVNQAELFDDETASIVIECKVERKLKLTNRKELVEIH